MHTPIIEQIEVVTRGDVRRAKLYYLRNLRGKAAKIKERRDTPSRRLSPGCGAGARLGRGDLCARPDRLTQGPTTRGRSVAAPDGARTAARRRLWEGRRLAPTARPLATR